MEEFEVSSGNYREQEPPGAHASAGRGAFSGGDAGRRGIDILIDAFRGWWFVILPALYLVAIVLLRLSPLIAAAAEPPEERRAVRVVRAAKELAVRPRGRSAASGRLRFLWLYGSSAPLVRGRTGGNRFGEYCARWTGIMTWLNALCGWYLKRFFPIPSRRGYGGILRSAARAGGLIRRRFERRG
jgi:hypothetical protein